MERIVCAAIRREDGLIVCGARHFDGLMHAAIAAIGGEWRQAEQGFVDQFGRFHTRETAWIIADAAEQIIRRVGGDKECLYSENLY